MIHLETRWKAAAPSPLGEPDEENNGDVEIDAAAGSDADDPLCDECDEGEEESDGSEDGDVSLNDGVAASQDCKVAPSNDGDVPAGQVCKVASPDNEDEAGSESDHGTLSAKTLRMGSPDRCDRSLVPRFSPTDDVFSSPFAGNSGPARGEVVQMCMALMQYFSDNYPEVLKSLWHS